ncbi:unnamed protein product [Closterium sp. Naga37s-1]|nr:unnamed protein product [Closterium sp. Naga37s-1]
MPVALGDEMHYPPLPFVAASAVSAPAGAAAEMSPLLAPSPAPPAGLAPAPEVAPPPAVESSSLVHAVESAPAPAAASNLVLVAASAPARAAASAPANAPAPTATPAPAPAPATPPAPAPEVPLVPVGVSVTVPVVAASSASVGAAVVPPLPAPAGAPSAAAADLSYLPPPATSAGLSPAGGQSPPLAPPLAPASPTAASPVPPPAVQGVPAPAPLPVTMADLQRVVSAAVREERNGQASQSNSPRVAPPQASLPPAAPFALEPPPPQSAVPPPHAHSASAAALGNRMRLPWVPPMAGMDFVTAAGGPVTGQYPSLLPVAPAPPAAALPPQSLVGPSPSTVVPEASLGQLWHLSEGLRAVHLIQVYGHAALAQGVPLDGGHQDECLDAADRLGELLAPVLAAPARGGVGQLGTAVRGLRRFLRAGTAVDLIGATTMVVRELDRSLTGLLAVLDADQM